MFSIVLYRPEIPPNTGNIIRLCANTNCQLHIIEPCAFSLDEKAVRRAGLDYHWFTRVHRWQNWSVFYSQCEERIISLSTKNTRDYSDFRYKRGDVLLFGSETAGLPNDVRNSIAESNRLHIPMSNATRSLNLSNSVAIVLYEAWRQHGFSGRTSENSTI